MFKGTTNIFEFTNSEVIDINLKYWLDQSLIEIGSYFQITIPSSGIFGGNQHKLAPVEDKNYTKGQVWQAFRGNWVWEDENLRPSGICINGIELDESAYTLDYIRGRVILNDAISVKSGVTANFTYKWINVYSANEIDWIRDLQGDSQRADYVSYSYGSGELYNRLQLPAIVYETTSKSFRPYALGGVQYSDNIVVLRVLGESRSDVSRIADILSEQNEKTIFLFDPWLLHQSGTFPLNTYGDLVSGALTYNDLIVPQEDGGYRWRKMTFFNGVAQEVDQLKNNVFHKPVRFRAELVLTDI